MENVSDRVPEKRQDDRAHYGAEGIVDARRSLDPAQIERSKQPCKKQGPKQARIRNLQAGPGQQIGHRLGAPNGADQRIENVIHRHTPSGDIAERGMQFAAHIGIGRAGAGIHPRHAAVAHGGEYHGDHRDQNRSDHMALAGVAEDSIRGHGRRGLDHNDAVHDQIPERERSPQARGVNGRVGSRAQFTLSK